MKRRHCILARVADCWVAVGQSVLLAFALAGAGADFAAAQGTAGAHTPASFSVEQFAHGAALDDAARSTGFAASAAQLQARLAAYCDRPGADLQAASALQMSWRNAQTDWDRLAAVAMGPLVARAVARNIDFMPARREMLDKAIASAPQNEEAMQRVGSPAVGFGALELLLFPAVPAPGSPRCKYATLSAGSIALEAETVAEQFRKEASLPADSDRAKTSFTELVNQWTGGVELLRWAFMRKPLEVGKSKGQPPQYPRRLSAQTKAMWDARWATLRAYAVAPAQAPDHADPAGGLVALETGLRGLGKNTLADQLAAAVRRVDHGMANARPQSPASVMAAANALGALTKLMQDKLAPALGVQLGFSDADGD